MREKQITIKPFLNTKLAAISSNLGQKLFPLYYQITFNRKNTQLKSSFDIYLKSLEDTNSSQKNLIEKEIKNLEKIIQLSNNQTGISLLGIKTKHDFYLKSVDDLLQEVLILKIQRAVSQSNSEFQNVLKFDGVGVNALLVYKATKLLIENINKHLPDDFKMLLDGYKAFVKSHQHAASLMEWLDGSFKNELKREFLAYFEGNQKEADKSFLFIDSIIAERLKYL